MIDLFAAGSGDSVTLERFANAPGKVRQFVEIVIGNALSVIGDEEKPVPTPGDISSNRSMTLNVDLDVRGEPVARDVGHGDAAVLIEVGFNDADRGLDAMGAGGDAAQMSEGDDEPDRPVPAHADVGDVIEVDDAGDARGIVRGAEEGANDSVGSARLVGHSRKPG